jgi:hypothetical protein
MDTKDGGAEERKRAIFESMGSRRRKHILERVGYDKWNPFQEPKDPIDIRTDPTRRTTQQLVREFLQGVDHARYSPAFGQGVLEIALGIINGDDRYIGMFEFSLWYEELLRRENAKPGTRG